MKKAVLLLLLIILLLCCAQSAAGADTVEDVPVMGTASAAAVEPVPAERVTPAAELQAITDMHVAKIVDLATGAETGYTSLMGAYQAAGARETLCEVVLLKDVTIVPKANSYGEKFPGAAISGMANDPECYLTWNLENTSDPEIAVKGFWLNLNGHTVTVNCTDYYQPCFYANSSIPVNIKNGAIYYKYNRSSQMLAFGIIACGYGSSESNYSEIGTETELFSPTITLKDATLIRVGTYRGPVICVKTLSSDIRLIRSTLFATKYSALLYSKNSYATTIPEDIQSVRHNLTLTDCRIGSADASNGAITATSVQRGRIVESSALNVTAQGVNHFIGSEPVTVDAEGPALSFSAPGDAADDTTVIAVPDVDSFATATTNDAVPEYPAAAAYATKRYGEPPHEHTTEHHEAVPATFLADGSIEYWYCTECEQYFSDGAYTNRITAEETVLARLVDAAGMQDAEMVALGAVAKAVAPDGGVKAYSDLNAAYREGATWTSAGGVVQMLCDYTHVDAVKAAAVGVVNNGAESRSNNQSWRYRNADEPSVDGFWFDLGGHTLAVRSGRPVFYAMESIPINIRNGRIVYQNTAGTASSYAPLKSGYTTSRAYTSTTVYCPEWTLDHVTFVRVPRASKSDFGAEGTPTTGPVFYVSTLQSRINIIDSTVICDDGSNAILYSKATPSANAAADAYAETQPYRHVVNLSGRTVFGRSSAGVVISSKSVPVTASAYEIAVNAEGEDVIFLGSSIFWAESELVSANCTLPEDYVSPEAKYSLVLPDVSSIARVTTPGAGASDRETATECVQWRKQRLIPGDVNGDAAVNAKDVTVLRRYLAGGYNVTATEAVADVNRDGTVNAKDVTLLRRYIAGGYGIKL